MKLSICQMVSTEDIAANLAEIDRLAQVASTEDADLAVFPEFAMIGVTALTPEVLAKAQPLDGSFVSGLAATAKRTGVTIVAGILEEIPGEQRAYNSLVVLTPADGLAAVYRKTHLYDAFGFKESDNICAGPLDGPVTIDVAGVRVGMLTCYDLRFPEASRQHADAGVDVLVYPAAWVPGPRKEDHWQTLARARAIENTFYVAAVSQGPTLGTGGSLIVDPMGLILGEVGERSGVATTAIKPERIAEVRATNPSLANRRFTVAAAPGV
ncbi:carbon-nitrogen hydrolase family protein [Leucobacter luti]|uniref:Putative amidohydrolase n=1 Tax=Leucobacter luti TaxID=340320 RepID=A0A4R6S3Q8_9MICO|nr:carbon-nitrogen hydrolase family protein [Leucobacter luti]QYM74940.1 carbon-nitrogen hydrolase family protein [Leucobacter luti]TDP93346.1 putative amidohydrolase [Leucobacter luti]